VPAAAQDLVTLAEAKDWLKIKQSDTSKDAYVQRLISDISDRFIQETDGREFTVVGTNPQSRDFDLEPWNWQLREVPIGDASSVTSASLITYSLDGTVADTVALSNLILLPRVRQSWEPITRIQFPYSIIQPAFLFRAIVRVTANYGFPAIPGTVRQAVLNAIGAIYDSDVEHYRQDLSTVVPTSMGGGEAGNVILMAGHVQRMLSLPPATLAVAWSFRGESTLV
jgi:hypothetical protein